MLVIRREQFRVLGLTALRNFEDEMVAHSRQFSPDLCRVLGDTQLRVAVHGALSRATNYGFTLRGPLQLFLEITFLCGSAFDTDPQYPGWGSVLQSSEHEMDRAMALHESHNNYLARVSGPDAANVRAALKAVAAFAREPHSISESGYVADMLSVMQRVFPQKVAYVGEAGLRAVISEASAEAARHRFSAVREQGLIAVLMFAFGHGCMDDPLYPWISSTLEDPRITSPEGRAKRLENKALTWLDHVLAAPEQAQIS
ncbi:MAG TPA: hypothetical protein VKH40_06200 [Alloacidobacterium sp.]|nr:hypothetical protein [Alloacidobacterium sp.]